MAASMNPWSADRSRWIRNRDQVIGATVNGTGGSITRRNESHADTLLSQIVHMVAQAQRSRAPIQKLARPGRLVTSVPAVAAAALIDLCRLGDLWAASWPWPMPSSTPWPCSSSPVPARWASPPLCRS